MERGHASVELKIPEALLERLTSLEISANGNLSGRHLYPLLWDCRNLETLVLDFPDCCFDESYGEPYDRFRESGVLLPNLHALRIENAHNVTGLELLRMPVLVELSILFEPDTAEIYINDTEDEFARLVRGHAASNSALRSLTIQGGFLAKDTLYNVLRNLTALTELTLDNVEFPRDVFSKLYAPVACLPELNTLKLPNLWVDVDKLLRLSEFLEERHAVLETSRGYWVESSDSED
jgi:hypothetical protein